MSPNAARTNYVCSAIPPLLLQRRSFNRKQNRRICFNLHIVRLDVVACADLPTHMRAPIFDVPFQTRRGDGCGAPHWKQADILREKSARLQSSKHAVFAPKNEGQTRLREEPQPEVWMLVLLSDHFVQES
jgi:hypothetical protein